MEEKGFWSSKTNRFNAAVVPMAAAIAATWPDYREVILMWSIAISAVGNFVLRTFYTSTAIKIGASKSTTAAIALFALLATGCGWRAYERSFATYATLNKTYAAAQLIVVELKRQDVISDADWRELRPLNDEIAQLDRVILALFVTIEKTRDAEKRGVLKEQIVPLLGDYIDLAQEILEVVEEFKQRKAQNNERSISP
jgi:hypothetical protein